MVLDFGNDSDVLSLFTQDGPDVFNMLTTSDEGGKNHVHLQHNKKNNFFFF